jgi:competence protein ComEA
MYRRLIILFLLLSVLFFYSVQVGTYDPEGERMIQVEVRGMVEEEGIVQLTLGSTFDDLLKKIKLTADADISCLSFGEVLYDGQIIVIPEMKNVELVSINSADLEKLMTLPGIGRSTAEKIIAYREENGSFYSLEDLMNVKGIGKKKFEKIRGFICL